MILQPKYDLPGFNENDHIYHWEGRIVESATQIIDRVGVRKSDGDYFTPLGCSEFAKNKHYSVFGKEFHYGASLIVAKQDCEYPDEMKPWFNEVGRFIGDYNVKPIKRAGNINIVECSLYSKIFNYCGTLDLFAETKIGLAIIDWKSSGNYMKNYSWQSAAYEQLLRETFGISKREKISRITVLFSPKYKENIRKNNPKDFISFQSILNTVRLAA